MSAAATAERYAPNDPGLDRLRLAVVARQRSRPAAALPARVVSLAQAVGVEAIPLAEGQDEAVAVRRVVARVAGLLSEHGGMSHRVAHATARRVVARAWLRTIGVDDLTHAARMIGASVRTLERDDAALAALKRSAS